MILCIVQNKKINIDNKITSGLGKISYGIYMYHWLTILFLIKILSPIENKDYYEMILYISVFTLTIFISWISYNTYENFFLNLKKKYETKL